MLLQYSIAPALIHMHCLFHVGPFLCNILSNKKWRTKFKWKVRREQVCYKKRALRDADTSSVSVVFCKLASTCSALAVLCLPIAVCRRVVPAISTVMLGYHTLWMKEIKRSKSPYRFDHLTDCSTILYTYITYILYKVEFWNWIFYLFILKVLTTITPVLQFRNWSEKECHHIIV